MVASGIVGAGSITIPEPAGDGNSYQVRLFFADPEGDSKSGERVMDVTIHGKKVLEQFDVVEAAGGPRRPLVREFEASAKDGEIVIELAARGSRPTLISGVELVRN